MPRPLVNRIDRYMFRQLLISLIAATGALVALIWLTQSLRFVELVVNRGLSLWVFLQLTGLLIPNFVAVILPITTFVVVQFVYGRLSGDRELTVMRSAGMSPARAVPPGAGGGGGRCPGLLGAEHLDRAKQLRRVPGIPVRDPQPHRGLPAAGRRVHPVSDDLTVYVRSRDVDGTLRGILVEDSRQKSSRATILAERGRLVEGPNGPAVLLVNGSRQEVDRQTGRLNVLTFAQNSVDLAQTSKAEDVRYRDVNEMSLAELTHPETSALNARDSGKFLVEAQRRLSAPFTALSFALVALQSVLAGTFRRHGNVLRPLAAVLAVVALLATQLAVANLAARSTVLLPLVWVVALGPGLVCAGLLFAPLPGAFPAGFRLIRAQCMTIAATLSLYAGPPIHHCRGVDAGGAVRPGLAVRLHRAAAPLRHQAGRDLRPRAAGRRVAVALYRHADPAIRGAAGRHHRVLAPHPVVGADRGAGGRRVRLAVPRRPGRLRAAARRHRDHGGEPALLRDARPRGDAGQHLSAQHRWPSGVGPAGSFGCGSPTTSSTRRASRSCTRSPSPCAMTC